MKVRLRVLHGSKRGHEIKVAGPHFFIGRGENCQLRAQSDLVSRRHCALILKDDSVQVRDLRSKNGTLVNGELIEGDVELKLGDKLKVGPLEFEVLVDFTIGGGGKRDKVNGVREAASRAASGNSATSSDDDNLDISSWLDEADEADRIRRSLEPETRQFRYDETERVAIDEAENDETRAVESAVEEEAKDKESEKKKKKEPGKLPRSQFEAKDTREAASETLKKLFSRR